MFWKTLTRLMYTFKPSKAGLGGSLGTILSNSFLFPDEEIGAQGEGLGLQPPREEGDKLGIQTLRTLVKNKKTHKTTHFQGPLPWPGTRALNERSGVYC